jgi:hypothetical protein
VTTFSISLMIDAGAQRRALRPATRPAASGLREICEDLGSAITLRVSGFGEERWDLSQRYDLLEFLQQLPSLLPLLRIGKDARLTLGAPARTVRFSRRGESLWVRADRTATWHPSPSSTLVNHDSFTASLTQLVRSFSDAVAALLPECADDLELVEWRLRSNDQYVGPPAPEEFRPMWTTEKHLWELHERGPGNYRFVHVPSNTTCIVENTLTAIVVGRNMRAAGVPVIPRETWAAKK